MVFMRFILILSLSIEIIGNVYSQSHQNIQSTKATTIINHKVLLDSIIDFLLLNRVEGYWLNHHYSKDRKIYSNHFISAGCCNYGFISIDTLNLAIRFNTIGTTGSGGFAPYFQETFYFQNFDTFYWSKGNGNVNILHLLGFVEFGKEHNYIVEVEEWNGNWGSEDRIIDFPDYSIKYYREYKIVFTADSVTDKIKDKLSSWLNELKTWQ